MNSPNDVKSLEVSRLAYAYPDGTQALFGVDLTIGRGERTLATAGPNAVARQTDYPRYRATTKKRTNARPTTLRSRAGLQPASDAGSPANRMIGG